MPEKRRGGKLEKRIRELEKELDNLKKLEFGYKVIFDNSPEVIAFTDPEGIILDINERISEWLNYGPEEIIGKKYSELEFFDNSTRKQLIKNYSSRVKGKGIPAYQIELTAKGGEKFIGQFVAKLIKGGNGNLHGILVIISDITKQYQQTEKYRAVSEKNIALFHAIPDFVFIMKRDGTFVEFKADYDEELAVPRENIVGRNIREMNFRPEYLELVDSNVKEALSTREVQTFEYELDTPGGVGIYECRMAYLNENEVLSVIRNISRHKLVDKELRLKNIVFETSIAANSIADINGNLTHVNKSFLDIWGYDKKSEVMGRPISDFFRETEKADAILEGLNNIGIWSGEFEGKKKDGSSFITEGFACVIHDADGVVAGYQSTNIDITEKRTSEVALRRNEEWYKALFDYNMDAVFIFDLDGIHLEANKKAQEILGCKSEEIIGRHISEFTVARESNDSRKKMLELLSGEKLPVYERTFLRKNGIEFPAELNVSLIYDNEGNPKYFQSIVRDISDKKKIKSGQ